MGQMMADVNVAGEIHAIKEHMKRQDDVLDRVSDVLVKQAEMTQQLINTDTKIVEHRATTDKRFDKVEARLDTMNGRIESNHSTITRWGGGIAALLAVVGLIATLLQILKP